MKHCISTRQSQLMVFVNEAYKVDALSYEYIEGFVRCCYRSHHIWEKNLRAILGNEGGISYAEVANI